MNQKENARDCPRTRCQDQSPRQYLPLDGAKIPDEVADRLGHRESRTRPESNPLCSAHGASWIRDPDGTPAVRLEPAAHPGAEHYRNRPAPSAGSVRGPMLWVRSGRERVNLG